MRRLLLVGLVMSFFTIQVPAEDCTNCAPAKSKTVKIRVDYSRTQAQLVDAGNYDLVAPIPLTMSPRDIGSREQEIHLLTFGTPMLASQVLAEFRRRELRPATLTELLALGAEHPDLEVESNGIVALGTTFNDGDHRSAAYLGFDRVSGDRYLLSLPMKWEWGSGRYFAALSEWTFKESDVGFPKPKFEPTIAVNLPSIYGQQISTNELSKYPEQSSEGIFFGGADLTILRWGRFEAVGLGVGFGARYENKHQDSLVNGALWDLLALSPVRIRLSTPKERNHGSWYFYATPTWSVLRSGSHHGGMLFGFSYGWWFRNIS